VLVALVVAIVILNYKTSNFQKSLNLDCVNSVTQLYYDGKCYVCPKGSSGISWVSPGIVECSTSDNRVVKANINAIQSTCPNNKSWKCPPGTKEYNNKCYFPCQSGYKADNTYIKCVPISGKGVNKGISSTLKGCYA